MTIWPALLFAPLLVLMQQSLAYSLVTPSCGHQSVVWLHLISGVSLLLVIAMTGAAAVTWVRASRAGDRPEAAASTGLAGRRERRPFLALLAMLVGALSALVALVMWIPVWLLSPCVQ
jgi:hypothetical protein